MRDFLEVIGITYNNFRTFWKSSPQSGMVCVAKHKLLPLVRLQMHNSKTACTNKEAKTGQIIQIEQRKLNKHLGKVVRDTVERSLNELLEAEPTGFVRCSPLRAHTGEYGYLMWSKKYGHRIKHYVRLTGNHGRWHTRACNWHGVQLKIRWVRIGPPQMLVGAHRGFGESSEKPVAQTSSFPCFSGQLQKVRWPMEHKKRQCKGFTGEFKNDAIKLVTEQDWSCNRLPARWVSTIPIFRDGSETFINNPSHLPKAQSHRRSWPMRTVGWKRRTSAFWWSVKS